jgi:hypothetical protein
MIGVMNPESGGEREGVVVIGESVNLKSMGLTSIEPVFSCIQARSASEWAIGYSQLTLPIFETVHLRLSQPEASAWNCVFAFPAGFPWFPR